ncbi:DUF3221 domain-containing protein [Oscillospiraceae bacterium 50-58]
MKKKAAGLVIAILCYSIAVAGVFYFIGYKTAYDHMETSVSKLIPQTFYATISEMQGNTCTVKGMEVNDINFRGEFSFSIVEETKIMWRYTEITPEDLEIGDHISITFTGEVLESYPAQIQQVDIIQLLDDER